MALLRAAKLAHCWADSTAGMKDELTVENLVHWMVALLEQLRVV